MPQTAHERSGLKGGPRDGPYPTAELTLDSAGTFAVGRSVGSLHPAGALLVRTE